jgi:hypothetical protein
MTEAVAEYEEFTADKMDQYRASKSSSGSIPARR